MNRSFKTAVVAAATATVIACFASTPVIAQDDERLATEEAKVSYGLGLFIGERFKDFGELDYDLLMEALKAQHAGSDTLMSIEEADGLLKAYYEKVQMAAQAEAEAAAKENAEKSQQYLDENKARDGVMVTDSGLQYEVISEADGPKPGVDDTVKVHYVGTFVNGDVFDSSVERGQPAEFPLGNVIKGWTEGLQLMNVGSKYRFVIPSDLAYGDGGGGRPAGTLVFEVELLEIL
ncbi:MAG: FKBP-type peptidyl-prolyl cis-trans isomerase [Granulosicoccus sp.]